MGQQAGEHIDQQADAAHQIELLKNQGGVLAQLAHLGREPAIGLQGAALQMHRATSGIELFQAAHAAQQGGLARARGAQQSHHLTWAHRQIHLVEGQASGAKGFAGLAQLQREMV